MAIVSSMQADARGNRHDVCCKLRAYTGDRHSCAAEDQEYCWNSEAADVQELTYYDVRYCRAIADIEQQQRDERQHQPLLN